MPKAKKSAEAWQYETAVRKIETILSDLESGEMPLAEIFEQFEQAAAELKRCDRFLREKQQQAQLLIETLADDDSAAAD